VGHLIRNLWGACKGLAILVSAYDGTLSAEYVAIRARLITLSDLGDDLRAPVLVALAGRTQVFTGPDNPGGHPGFG
jgi:hypothetical protein